MKDQIEAAYEVSERELDSTVDEVGQMTIAFCMPESYWNRI